MIVSMFAITIRKRRTAIELQPQSESAAIRVPLYLPLPPILPHAAVPLNLYLNLNPPRSRPLPS